MGMCLEPTMLTGEYSVEVRRESFYLSGDDNLNGDRRHAIFLYPTPPMRTGTVEILIEDIPKIRACLDQVEEYVRERG